MEGVEAGGYCVDSVKCSCEDEVVVYGEFVESFCEVALVY